MNFLSALANRLLEALDYEPARCRVYLAHRGQEYPYNVDCSDCHMSPIESINLTTRTVTMASTPGLANEKARKHLLEHHYMNGVNA